MAPIIPFCSYDCQRRRSVMITKIVCYRTCFFGVLLENTEDAAGAKYINTTLLAQLFLSSATNFSSLQTLKSPSKTRFYQLYPTSLTKMPGMELFGSSQPSAPASTIVDIPASTSSAGEDAPRNPGVYYNARLDPKNFLEGPLSLNPATRLRQMLARPGIVVSICNPISPIRCAQALSRLLLVSATVSAHVAPWRLASIACTNPARLPPPPVLACPIWLSPP
jgi:hypothetical protein